VNKVPGGGGVRLTGLKDSDFVANAGISEPTDPDAGLDRFWISHRREIRASGFDHQTDRLTLGKVQNTGIDQ
jgi:hypothetical protein